MYEAEGLLFETEEEAKKAKSEAEGIQYLKEKTSVEDPDKVLNLYNNLLDKKLFRTEVGLKYLFELQTYLNSIPYIKSEDIKPIPTRKVAYGTDSFKDDVQKTEKTIKQAKSVKKANPKEISRWKRRCAFLGLIAAVLLASVIGMFVVALTSKDAQERLDFENSIIDKYSSWEQDLQEREQKLQQKQME